MLPSLPSRALTQFGADIKAAMAPDLDRVLQEHLSDEERAKLVAIQKKISNTASTMTEKARNGEIQDFSAVAESYKEQQKQVCAGGALSHRWS